MSEQIKTHWNERWIDVVFDSATKSCKYAISNYGRIKSINKTTKQENLLKGAIVNRGLKILNVKLRDDSTGYQYIHLFVAENFVKKPSKEHKHVIHIDFDKNNNKWNNLKWVTEEAWKAHVRQSPDFVKGKEKRMRKYKLTEAKVRMMKKMLLNDKIKGKS